MQLNTFSAVLEAAISLEKALVKRYGSRPEPSPTEAATIYRELVKDGGKRIKLLERIRREMVTEMILEPIQDLELPDTLTGLLDDSDPNTPTSPVEAKTIESAMADFYDDAASKIGLDEAARALRRLAKGSNRRAERLATLEPG